MCWAWRAVFSPSLSKKKDRKEVLVSPHSRMLVGLLSAFQARLWAFPPGILLVSGAWSWWGHSCQGSQGQTRVSGWDFPGGQEVKTELPLQEAQVRALVRELRSHMPWGQYKERHLPPSPPPKKNKHPKTTTTKTRVNGLFVPPSTILGPVNQAPLSMDISRQEYWIVSTQGLNPGLLHCRWIFYHLSHQGSPKQSE